MHGKRVRDGCIKGWDERPHTRRTSEWFAELKETAPLWTSEDAVLAALDRLSGHNFGHSGSTSEKGLPIEPLLSASND